jgi:hypothetical protein
MQNQAPPPSKRLSPVHQTLVLVSILQILRTQNPLESYSPINTASSGTRNCEHPQFRIVRKKAAGRPDMNHSTTTTSSSCLDQRKRPDAEGETRRDERRSRIIHGMRIYLFLVCAWQGCFVVRLSFDFYLQKLICCLNWTSDEKNA